MHPIEASARGRLILLDHVPALWAVLASKSYSLPSWAIFLLPQAPQDRVRRMGAFFAASDDPLHDLGRALHPLGQRLGALLDQAAWHAGVAAFDGNADYWAPAEGLVWSKPTDHIGMIRKHVRMPDQWDRAVECLLKHCVFDEQFEHILPIGLSGRPFESVSAHRLIAARHGTARLAEAIDHVLDTIAAHPLRG